MIGFIDGDTYMHYMRRYLPNLQLMKLFGYLKKQGEIVKLLQYPHEYKDCTQIYLREQHHNSPTLDDRFFDHSNIQIGGSLFSHGKYIPFKNQEIEYETPQYRLYKDFILIKRQRKLTPKTLVESAYLRLDGPNKNWRKQIIEKKPLFIYDQNPYNIIDLIPEFCGIARKVGFNHPMTVTTLSQYYHFKQIFSSFPINKIRKNSFTLRFDVDMRFYDFKSFLLQEIEFIKNLGVSGFQSTINLENSQNLQYNIIEAIYKYYLLASCDLFPLMYYKPIKNNPYANLCECFQGYANDCEDRRMRTFLRYIHSYVDGTQARKQIDNLMKFDDYILGFFSLVQNELVGREIVYDK